MPAVTERLRTAQAAALASLRQAAENPMQIAAAVDRIADSEPNLRCARPLSEDFARGYPRPPGSGASALLAVDGSQVVPDRNDEVLFAIINIGVVLLVPGSGAAPQVSVETNLMYGDELLGVDGRALSEGDIALRRDSAERRALTQLAPEYQGLLALTDGPLELWGAKDTSDPRAFEIALEHYLSHLREVLRRGHSLAGYVDKPGANLVVRMLEVARMAGSSGNAPDVHPFIGASDRWLFGRVLQPGERSAILIMQSSSRHRYTGDLEIHFFYLNTGTVSQPAIARVEIPTWMARDQHRLDSLHASLLDQCSQLGARPYPYILHRAHETARISVQEREQIRLRLLLELRNHGFQPESISGKSSAKAVSTGRGK